MTQPSTAAAGRYLRQVVYPGLGAAGQRRLAASSALVVGVGGLGCTVADLLARAGVGHLRLVDDDRVSLENLHRQVLFDEVDAAAGAAKVQAAARRLGRINGQVRLEAVSARFGPDNALELAGGMDVIVDGTDNFASRFVINDLAVQEGIPWVFAGVVGAEGQTMTVVPGRTPCLRCVFESPPPPCLDPSCRSAGVLGPAVAALAALEAMEALKILSGRPDSASRWLRKFDFWSGGFQQIDLAEACERSDCPCCKRRQFDFLHP